jgi:feruloyl esterase
MPPFAAEISNSYLKYLAFPKSPPASFSYKDWQFTAEGFDRLRPLGKVELLQKCFVV